MLAHAAYDVPFAGTLGVAEVVYKPLSDESRCPFPAVAETSLFPWLPCPREVSPVNFDAAIPTPEAPTLAMFLFGLALMFLKLIRTTHFVPTVA